MTVQTQVTWPRRGLGVSQASTDTTHAACPKRLFCGMQGYDGCPVLLQMDSVHWSLTAATMYARLRTWQTSNVVLRYAASHAAYSSSADAATVGSGEQLKQRWWHGVRLEVH